MNVKSVSPVHCLPLPPQEIFLVFISVMRMSQPQCLSVAGKIMSMKNSMKYISICIIIKDAKFSVDTV